MRSGQKLAAWVDRPMHGVPRPRRPEDGVDISHPSGKVYLHELLTYVDNPEERALKYDIRWPTNTIQALMSGIPTLALSSPACNPSQNSLIVECAYLPSCFNIEIQAGNHPEVLGVTVSDVLMGIYADLQKSVSAEQFYALIVNEDERQEIYRAFEARCEGNDLERRKGLRRVDLLGGATNFLGFVRSSAAPNQRWVLRVE
ncbi:hypothetical protein DL96DRAFT_945646 [Flagelloscypha sp. PMI_526]|nr:hypothetical protein DL96DRAFT_945646 [Flagelloscypha sp. PMI_526]